MHDATYLGYFCVFGIATEAWFFCPVVFVRIQIVTFVLWSCQSVSYWNRKKRYKYLNLLATATSHSVDLVSFLSLHLLTNVMSEITRKANPVTQEL